MQTDSKKIALSDDPVAALMEIALFLNTIPMGDGNRYPPEADKRRFTGYVLPVEFVYGLIGLAHEAERVARQEVDQSSAS